MSSTSGPGRPQHFAAGGAGRRGRNRVARLPRRARLTASRVLTETGTIQLEFQIVDDDPFDFVPGQFVAIDMNHPRYGYRRSPYCLLDGSEQERTFELLIRRVAEGPVSLFLADLNLGDIISFRGAAGHSMIPSKDDTELVMLATGVGVSPCVCLLRWLLASQSRHTIRLFWGLRLVEDICITPELDSLTEAHPDFEYDITLSQPTDRWTGLRGRVTESVPPLLHTVSDKHFYLVSNGEMIAEMSEALQNLGVSRERIYEESFFNHRYRPDREAVAAVEARFVAADLERPIERLARELARFPSSWRGS